MTDFSHEPGGRRNECNNPRAESNQRRLGDGLKEALGDVQGENVKFRRQNTLFCAAQSAFRPILRRNKLQISRFQKNFTNRIFSR